jgi:hypothetical protein
MFLVLARILLVYAEAGLDFTKLLTGLSGISFKRDEIAKLGGGWKGFRALANKILRKLNKTQARSKRFRLYGEKEKV